MSKFARELYICGKTMGEQAKAYSNPKKKSHAKNMEVIYYKQAMSLGYVKPAYDLYERFRDGEGVEQNNDMALVYLSIAWKLKDKRCDPEITLSGRLIEKANTLIKFVREAYELQLAESDLASQTKLFNAIPLTASLKVGDCFMLPYIEPLEYKDSDDVKVAGADIVQSKTCVVQ